MTGTRKKSATSSPRVPQSRYVAVRSLSIEASSYHPGDALSESDVGVLLPGRIEVLLRGGWVRPA